MIAAVALASGCRKPPPVEAPAAVVDPAALAGAAWGRELPDGLRSSFGISVEAPRMGVGGSASGALVVDRPDHVRIEIYAPIIGPRFYAVSDGQAAQVFVVSQKTWMGSEDVEETLRSATGGVAGIRDLVDVFTGRMPFEEAEVVGVEQVNGETLYTFQGPSGTTAEVTVDDRQLTTRRIEAFDAAGASVLQAEYSDYKRSERALMPELLTLTVPSLELMVQLSYREWAEMVPVETAFTLAPPRGSREKDLLEALREWAGAREE